MRKSRNRFLKRSAANEEMSLNITSMADVFTIILVFLMKSYATGALNIEPPKGITLPTAHVTSEQDGKDLQAIRVEISNSAISLERKLVTQMADFLVSSGDLSQAGAIRSLQGAMKPATKNAKIMIIADQRAPYSTIKAVLVSAAAKGYTNVKLAVTHE